jgi:hypothetical protein
MIGHEQKEVRPPQKLLLPMTDGFKQAFGNVWQGELIPAAFLAVDADEIGFLVRVHPRRNLMREKFAVDEFHAREIVERERKSQVRSFGGSASCGGGVGALGGLSR